MRSDESSLSRMRPLIISFLVLATGVAAVPVFWFLEAEYNRRYPPISFMDVAEEPAILMDGIESYGSLKDFLQKLDARNYAYQVDQPQSQSRRTDKPVFEIVTEKPVFEIVTVDIQAYPHLGSVGQMSVSFFNGRLSSMLFYPAEFDGYLTALQVQIGVEISARLEVRPSDNVRIWSAVDHLDRSYVLWEDARLAQEFDLWMKLYVGS